MTLTNPDLELEVSIIHHDYTIKLFDVQYHTVLFHIDPPPTLFLEITRGHKPTHPTLHTFSTFRPPTSVIIATHLGMITHQDHLNTSMISPSAINIYPNI